MTGGSSHKIERERENKKFVLKKDKLRWGKIMLEVVITEDDVVFREQIKEYIIHYQKEKNIAIHITEYSDGAELLENYTNRYEIILLDIDMPNVNGMDAARKIRERDEDVVLVFITNLSQFAVKGYEVEALDFVVKPITYENFSMKMDRARKRVKNIQKKEILLSAADGIKKIAVKDIYYIEGQNRNLYYHTKEGVFCVKGTMYTAEKEMAEYHFVKCNHWYMVNLEYVQAIGKESIKVQGEELAISRRKRSEFLKSLAEYVGGNI